MSNMQINKIEMSVEAFWATVFMAFKSDPIVMVLLWLFKMPWKPIAASKLAAVYQNASKFKMPQ